MSADPNEKDIKIVTKLSKLFSFLNKKKSDHKINDVHLTSYDNNNVCVKIPNKIRRRMLRSKP